MFLVRNGLEYTGRTSTEDHRKFKIDAAMMLTRGHENTSTLTAITQSKTKVPFATSVNLVFPTMWETDIDNCEKVAIDVAFKRLGLDGNFIVGKDTKKRLIKTIYASR